MSISWGTLRDTYVRVFLGDEDTGESTWKGTWTQAELLLYCIWALDDFTNWRPRTRTLTLASDTKSFALPDDFYRVNLVEWQRTDYYRKFLEEVPRRPGWQFPSSEVDDDSYPIGYWIDQNVLYLGRTAEVDFTLHYLAYWPTPSGDGDSITVPRWARQALVFYIAAMALLRKSIGFAKIRQWNTRMDSGRPTDEPLLPEIEFLIRQYKEIISTHVGDTDWNVHYEGRL